MTPRRPSRALAALALAMLVAACAGTPPPSPMSRPGNNLTAQDAAADEATYRAVVAAVPAGPVPTLMTAVARRFLGRPYRAHMLDDFPLAPGAVEPLVSRLDAFDCVTYVESTLAISRSIAAGAPSYDAFRRALERVRYRGGARGPYDTRLHYFSEWIADNARKGHLTDLTASLGGQPDRRAIDFMSAHRERYPRLADEATFARVRAAEQALSATTRPVLPAAKVRGILGRLRSGDVIGFATAIPGLDVVHTGVLEVDAAGVVRFLHAPQPGEVVQVSRQPLADYLASHPKDTGVLVARPEVE